VDFLNEELPEEQTLENAVTEQPAVEVIREEPAEEVMMEQSAQEPASVQPAAHDKPRADNWQKRLYRDAKDVLYMLAIFMLVYILCFRTVVVVGDSMYDTLVNGDRLLLTNNLLYGQPKQGDVVVASKDAFRDGECIIKRVIATEGQEVDIDFESGIVYVNGEALPEPYLHTKTLNYEGMLFPVVVPEGCLFVMGDNRMESLDSRSPSIGFIDEREILGKAVFILIPGIDPVTGGRDFGRMGVIG
jgi:signal peptidase I